MKSHFTDVEVASAAVLTVVDKLESCNAYPDDLPAPHLMRQKGHRISWGQFCELLAEATKHLGRDGLKQAAIETLSSPRFRRL